MGFLIAFLVPNWLNFGAKPIGDFCVLGYTQILEIPIIFPLFFRSKAHFR